MSEAREPTFETGAPADNGRRLADFSTDPRVLLLTFMAGCVGLFGTVAAWLLVKLIGLVTNIVWFGTFTDHGPTLTQAPRNWWMVAAPAVGGLIIGLMARYGSSKIRGHGIPEAIETILIGESRIGPKVALLKPLSSAISIGTGGPFGAEGPIIMTGGALGSLFAQFFSLSAAERKSLLVAGAAAGMTAIFGTPMAAVLLAVELLLFEWKPRSFIPVSVAALVAIGLRPFLFGPAPLFPVPAIPDIGWAGLAAAGAIGILAGLLSGALTYALYQLEDAFERLPVHWMWWPAIGGIFVGLGGLLEPRALGVGYDVIADLLNDRMVVSAVLLVLAVKAVIWLVALSSGTSGGVLAPLLIIGGAFGSLVGGLYLGHPGFWALIGMSAMLGGTMRAPLTGAIFAAELTGSLHGLPALLCGTVCAYGVTVLLLKRSILTEKIARRGQHIIREYAIDAYELTRAADIMAKDVATLPATMTVAAAIETFATAEPPHTAYPVVDSQGLVVGMATRAAALAWRQGDDIDPTETLADRLSDASCPIAYPTDVAGYVADLMIAESVGLIPIVEPATRRLRGVISRKDLLTIRQTAANSEQVRQRYYRGRSTIARRGAATVRASEGTS